MHLHASSNDDVMSAELKRRAKVFKDALKLPRKPIGTRGLLALYKLMVKSAKPSLALDTAPAEPVPEPAHEPATALAEPAPAEPAPAEPAPAAPQVKNDEESTYLFCELGFVTIASFDPRIDLILYISAHVLPPSLKLLQSLHRHCRPNPPAPVPRLLLPRVRNRQQ